MTGGFFHRTRTFSAKRRTVSLQGLQATHAQGDLFVRGNEVLTAEKANMGKQEVT